LILVRDERPGDCPYTIRGRDKLAEARVAALIDRTKPLPRVAPFDIARIMISNSPGKFLFAHRVISIFSAVQIAYSTHPAPATPPTLAACVSAALTIRLRVSRHSMTVS